MRTLLWSSGQNLHSGSGLILLTGSSSFSGGVAGAAEQGQAGGIEGPGTAKATRRERGDRRRRERTKNSNRNSNSSIRNFNIGTRSRRGIILIIIRDMMMSQRNILPLIYRKVRSIHFAIGGPVEGHLLASKSIRCSAAHCMDFRTIGMVLGEDGVSIVDSQLQHVYDILASLFPGPSRKRVVPYYII